MEQSVFTALLERLRAAHHNYSHGAYGLYGQAADEIEQLRDTLVAIHEDRRRLQDEIERLRVEGAKND